MRYRVSREGCGLQAGGDRVVGSALLLDVGPQEFNGAPATEPAKYDPDHSRLARQ